MKVARRRFVLDGEPARFWEIGFHECAVTMRTLLKATALPALRHLRLIHCPLPDPLVVELVDSQLLVRLDSLELCARTIGPGATDALVAGAPALRHLASLDLSGAGIHAADRQRIRDVLANAIV